MKNILLLLIVVVVSLASYRVCSEPIWIDVRSSIEHALDNIDGDVRISHTEIVNEISALHPDKNTEIILYCRSGGRADKALLLLNDAGYKNVLNAGSINDARLARGIEH